MIGNSDTNATYIFRNKATFFEPRIRIRAFESEVKLVDITDDGNWILAVELNGLIHLINYHRENNTVVLFKLPFNLGNQTEAGAISDDSKWLFFGDHSGRLYVTILTQLNSDTASLILAQILEGDGPIHHISLTADKQFLAYSTIGKKVYVYKKEDQYVALQTIEYENEAERKVVLTNDHQFMSVSGGSDKKAYFYKYEAQSGKFEEYLEKKFDEDVEHVVVSEDKNWVVVSEKYHAHILSGLVDGELQN